MSDDEKPSSAESELSHAEPFCIGSHDGKTLFVIGDNFKKKFNINQSLAFVVKVLPDEARITVRTERK